MPLYKLKQSGNNFRLRRLIGSGIYDFLPNPLAIFGANLQFWGNSSQQFLSTDGAVNLVAASSQSLSVAGTPFVLSSDWTCTFWYNPATASTMGLLDKDSGAGGLNISTTTTGPAVSGWNGSAYQVAGKTGTISTGTNYFVSVQYVAATKTLSIDLNNSGTPGTVVLTGSGLVNPSQILRLGVNAQTGNTFFSGTFSQLNWHGVALSPALITLLYAGGSGLPFELWPSSLLTSLVSVYQFRQPGNLGLASFGSNTLTLNNTPTYVAGKVVGVPSLTGEAVSVIADQSTNANNGSQTTGANRYTLLLNQFNGLPAIQSPASGWYNLTTSSNALNGVFGAYGVINKLTSSTALLFGRQAGNTFVGNGATAVFVVNDAAGAINSVQNPSGKIIVRLRRDASNNCYYACTGTPEILIGNLSGTITLDQLWARGGSGTTWNSGQSVEEQFLVNVDPIATDQNTPALAYLTGRTGLSLP